MCGIVGIISKLSRGFVKEDTSLFYQMLVVDSLRGSDGTGVWGTYPSGNVVWTKLGGGPHAMFATDEYLKWESAMQRTLTTAIGHNRFATSGGEASEHAHPFVKDHIIVCHNGVIHNHAEIRPNAPKNSVDSECIAHLLAREKDYVKAVESLQGAYAIVWYNALEKKTYFVRNDERPLFYMELKDTIVLMSERTALEFIRNRNGISDKAVISSVPDDKIFCWDHVAFNMTSVPYKFYVAAAEVGYNTAFLDKRWWGANENVAVAQSPGYPATAYPAGNQNVYEEVCKTIPIGARITVAPTQVVPWDIPQHDGLRLEAHTKFKEIPLIYKYSSDDIPRMETLGKSKFIEGTVVSHLYSASHIAIWLKDVKPLAPEQTFSSFNGVHVTFKEWGKISRDSSCKKCQGRLKANGLKLTTLKFKPNRHEWRATCPQCTIKSFRNASEHAQTLMESKAGFDVQEKAQALGVWDEPDVSTVQHSVE